MARCLAMCYLQEMQWIHSAACIDAVRARACRICASLTEVPGVLDAATAAGC